MTLQLELQSIVLSPAFLERLKERAPNPKTFAKLQHEATRKLTTLIESNAGHLYAQRESLRDVLDLNATIHWIDISTSTNHKRPYCSSSALQALCYKPMQGPNYYTYLATLGNSQGAFDAKGHAMMAPALFGIAHHSMPALSQIIKAGGINPNLRAEGHAVVALRHVKKHDFYYEAHSGAATLFEYVLNRAPKKQAQYGYSETVRDDFRATVNTLLHHGAVLTKPTRDRLAALEREGMLCGVSRTIAQKEARVQALFAGNVPAQSITAQDVFDVYGLEKLPAWMAHMETDPVTLDHVRTLNQQLPTWLQETIDDSLDIIDRQRQLVPEWLKRTQQKEDPMMHRR